eukprot:759697-Hanusia_phi.AAC.1
MAVDEARNYEVRRVVLDFHLRKLGLDVLGITARHDPPMLHNQDAVLEVLVCRAFAVLRVCKEEEGEGSTRHMVRRVSEEVEDGPSMALDCAGVLHGLS